MKKWGNRVMIKKCIEKIPVHKFYSQKLQINEYF